MREGKIDGDAIVGSGYSARIDVELARAQLDARLHLGQRLGANGRAELEGGTGPTLDADIKAARLRELELSNERAAAEAMAVTGRYVEADAARREMGAIAGRLVASLEGGLPSLADAVADRFQLPPRDVLHVLRTAWLALRTRLAGETAAAAIMSDPEVVEAAQ